MRKYSQYVKNGLLYSLIGLAMMGGVMVVSSKIALAAVTITDNGTYYHAASDTGMVCGYRSQTFVAPEDIKGDISDGGYSSSVNIDYQTTGTWYYVVEEVAIGTPELACASAHLSFSEVFVTSDGNFDSDFTTHFISVKPVRNSNVSQGTVNFEADMYINATDLANNNGVLSIETIFHRESPANSLASPNIDITHDNPVIHTSGHVIATTSSVVDYPSIWTGAYIIHGKKSVAWWQYMIDSVNVLGFNPFKSQGDVLFVGTTTYFSVGTLSPSQEAQFHRLQNTLDRQASTTITFDLSQCAFFTSNWSGEACIDALFTLTGQEQNKLSTDIQAGFLMAAPFGYVVRAIDIINASTSTSTLPLLSYTFPNSFPVFGGMNFHFDVYAYMLQASDLVNNTFVSNVDGKNVWQIFQYFIDVFIAIVLLLAIFHDITGIDFSEHADTKNNFIQ